jgi:hypothetical protein
VTSLTYLGWVSMPYGLATSGLALGFAGAFADRPVLGLWGAVAGVAAGVVQWYRAQDAERTAGLLRTRLRDQRSVAETEASELRRRVRELETELWARDLRDLGAPAEVPLVPTPPVVELVLDAPSGPIARVIDLSEAREQSAVEPRTTRTEPRAAG